MERREALKGLVALAALPLVGELPVASSAKNELMEAFAPQLKRNEIYSLKYPYSVNNPNYSQFFRLYFNFVSCCGQEFIESISVDDLPIAHLKWKVIHAGLPLALPLLERRSK